LLTCGSCTTSTRALPDLAPGGDEPFDGVAEGVVEAGRRGVRSRRRVVARVALLDRPAE
jgi:hypothetical protein